MGRWGKAEEEVGRWGKVVGKVGRWGKAVGGVGVGSGGRDRVGGSKV